MPIIRIGIDIDLFRTLASSTEPLTVHQLAETTHASAELLGRFGMICQLFINDAITDTGPPTERILRYLASNNVVKEVECNKYQTCNLTFVFASEKGEAMICHG